jgi:RNA polymerase sigma factor (sigma-70 family)
MTALEPFVIAAQQGDSKAFGHIVQRFQDMAYAIGYARIGDRQLAEDIAQEAFLEAYLHLTELAHPAAFPGWFRTIVTRQCNRVLRRKSATLVSLDALSLAASPVTEPASAIETIETQHVIHQAVMALPMPERQVVTLFYIAGYSLQEIAALLEVRVSTVKNRLFSARLHLRERILDMIADNLPEQRPSKNEAFATRVMEFIKATETGEADRVREMLDEEPTLADSKGTARFAHEELYPLHHAALYGFKEIVEQLLYKGANVNVKSDAGWTPLLCALMAGQHDIASLLIRRGATVDIFAACRLGDLERVKGFVSRDAEIVHARGPCRATPLHFAATAPMAKILLDAGADLNARDDNDRDRYRYGTPLRWNADNTEVAHYLLSRGAEIDDVFLACALGDVQRVQAFLESDPQSIYQHNGPYRGELLHTAADKGHVEIARLILGYGADANAKSAEGAVTPLHLAAANGHLAVIQFLVAQGADLSARDSEFGGTPRGWAKFWKQDAAVHLLRTL